MRSYKNPSSYRRFVTILCAKLKKKIIVRAGWEPTLNYQNWNINFAKYSILILNSFLSYKLSNKIMVTSNEIKVLLIKIFYKFKQN